MKPSCSKTLICFLCMVAGLSVSAQDSAVRDLESCYNPGAQSTVALTLSLNNAPGFVVIEAVPSGWGVASISDGGSFVAAKSEVRWLVLAAVNGQKVLTYEISPPANAMSAANFSGVLSVAGVDSAIGGDSSMDLCGPADMDGDGVTDDLDQCPNTPAGAPVDASGCADSQRDSDNDGVTDDLDQCLGTPTGAPVDANGCADSQKDSDGDGVTDDLDQCPNTPAGTPVDANGCPLADSDEDGVPDGQDQCPNTPAGTQVNANGCPLPPADSDGDGVPNGQDQCPNTPAGTPVDANGCPLPPTDSDGDGVPDGQDQCPDTPFSLPVDANGCDVCAPPSKPTNVQATDGTHSDRVIISWDPVANAAFYEVYRSSDSNFAHAEFILDASGGTNSATDFITPPSMVGGFGCPSNASPVTYWYWVVALGGPCADYSDESLPDSGYVGSSKQLSGPVYQSVIPAEADETGTHLAAPDGMLAIRLRGDDAIDSDSVWGEVTVSGTLSTDVAWFPASADSDGWVVYTPDTPWQPGEVVTMTAGALTTSGEALQSDTFQFLITEGLAFSADDAEDAATVTALVDSGDSPLYSIEPAAVYEEPQRILLPVPIGADAAHLNVYYYKPDGDDQGWYPAENVIGFLVPGSQRVVEIDGAACIEIQVNHSGIVQAGEAAVVNTNASLFNPTQLTTYIQLLATILLLAGIGLWTSRRKVFAPKGNRAG